MTGGHTALLHRLFQMIYGQQHMVMRGLGEGRGVGEGGGWGVWESYLGQAAETLAQVFGLTYRVIQALHDGCRIGRGHQPIARHLQPCTHMCDKMSLAIGEGSCASCLNGTTQYPAQTKRNLQVVRNKHMVI